jgi:hypothetical protein
MFVQMLERNLRFFHRETLGLTIVDSSQHRQVTGEQLNSAAKSR